MKRRVLLSAYFCSPYQGSESAVGWNMAINLAKHHNVTVLCGDINDAAPTRMDLERYCQEHGLPDGLEISHVQIRGVARFFHWLHCFPGLWFFYYAAYRRWQIQALKRARELHAITHFDLVHHLTVISYREPGYLWKLGIPFFWGPISGASTVPLSYISGFCLSEKLRWFTHNILNRAQISWSKRSREAANAATHIWSVSREDQLMLKSWGNDSELMPEFGTTEIQPNIKVFREGELLRICWSGIFQGRKALHLLLMALTHLPQASFELNVLGDGPEERRWKHLSNKLGISSNIFWHGRLSRDKATKLMDNSHVVAITSLKEASSIVTFEAIERGLPVICHNACGIGIVVNDACGIKVPLRDPETSINGFAEALNRLLSTPNLVESLSRGALERAKELTWDRHIQRICQTYNTI